MVQIGLKTYTIMNKYFVNIAKVVVPCVLFSAIFFSSQCGLDRPDCRLNITNNSNKTIRYMIICNVPDTTRYYGSCHEGDISPKTSKKECVDSNWENHFLNNGSLRIYIIDKDTLNKYGINILFENRSFLKSLYLGIREADSLNWTIIYP